MVLSVFPVRARIFRLFAGYLYIIEGDYMQMMDLEHLFEEGAHVRHIGIGFNVHIYTLLARQYMEEKHAETYCSVHLMKTGESSMARRAKEILENRKCANIIHGIIYLKRPYSVN